MKRFLAVGTLLLVLGSSARADSITANIVVGNIGETLGNSQYAGTFTVTDNTTSSGPFTAFCADLTDHVYASDPWTYTGTVTTGGLPNSLSPTNVWSGTTYPTDLGLKLNYVLTQIMAPGLAQTGGLTNAEAAAIQTAIWNLMGNYGYNSGTDSTLVNAIMTLVGATGANGSAVSGTGWSLLNSAAAYSKTETGGYASSSEFLIVPAAGANPTGQGPLEYQVLLGVTPPGETITSVATPEPSTLAIAGLGALGFLGYGWKRRKRS